MDDSLLLKVSFILALVGISILIVLSDKLSLDNSSISSIDEGILGNNVKIKGIVTPIRLNNLMQIFQVQDNTGNINVVLYKNDLKINKGSIVEVEGHVTKYNNELQVSGDLIKVIS